jgi:tetratricopeptide (TPR) repeat protein
MKPWSICALLLITLAGILGFRWLSIDDGGGESMGSPPELISVQKHQATIAWTTETAVKGRVSYRPAASDSPPALALEKVSRTYRHEVVLPNLKPGSRYTYWIDNPDQRYQFQTMPESQTPFSFLLVTGAELDPLPQWVMGEFPDFILLANPKPEVVSVLDAVTTVRPYLPIFDAAGAASLYLRQPSEAGPTITSRADWHLDWGGLRLVVLNQSLNFAPLVAGYQGHTLGLWVTSGAAGEEPLDWPADEAENELHEKIRTYNQMHPKQAIQFVLFSGKQLNNLVRDEVHYLMLPVKDPAARTALRLDIDLIQAKAVNLIQRQNFPLKRSPLGEKITCAECRRMADRGTYAAALAAYKTFIRNNQDHYQIDDAYFAIAEIYDDKLFDPAQAQEWYAALTAAYPLSPLSPLARQRVDFLQTHSDFGYAPLKGFEKIRKMAFARKGGDAVERTRLLEAVAGLIETYPAAAIAPTMQHWLASQLRQDHPQRAISAFEKLSTDYPEAVEAREARLNIADILYAAGRYREAREVYSEVLAAQPERQEAIEAQMRRCGRNIRRVWLAWFSAGLLTASALGTVVLTHRRPPPSSFGWRQMTGALAVLLAINWMVAWLIHEQFQSLREMLTLVGTFSLLAVMAARMAVGFLEGMLVRVPAGSNGAQPHISLAAACGLGATLLAAGGYLIVFWVNVHYLIIFQL